MRSGNFTTPDLTIASFNWDQSTGAVTAIPHVDNDPWCAWFNDRGVVCRTLYDANELAIRYGASFITNEQTAL